MSSNETSQIILQLLQNDEQQYLAILGVFSVLSGYEHRHTDIDGTWNSKCYEWKVTVTSHNQETSFIESKQFKFFIVSEREIFLSPIKLEHMK